MSFGPSPEVWDNDQTGERKITIEQLADVGAGGLTDLDLMKAGEHTPDTVPLEDTGGRRIGTVANIHYSEERRALVGEVSTVHIHRTEELTTVFRDDKSRVDKVVLVR